MSLSPHNEARAATASARSAFPARSSPKLSALQQPFDSFWEGPAELEAGFRTFGRFYRANYLAHFPPERSSRILVVSCGPGYLLHLLGELGYSRVLGIDSDPAKLDLARARRLPCREARAFEFLAQADPGSFDVIFCEQEINHLTREEALLFLELCRKALRPGGRILLHSLNGANPLTGADALAQNLDHFTTFTEHSLVQLLELAGYQEIRVFPLRLYVFYHNPLNYLALLATAVLEAGFRVAFRLYNKSNRCFSKKIGAVARTPGPEDPRVAVAE